MARALLLIALACVAAVALASGPQTYQCENHFFRVADAALSNGKDAGWSANDDITITIVGRDHDHELTAGTLRYELFEYKSQYKVAQGNSPYFACNNKGCDKTHPIALALADPNSKNSRFTASMSFTTPPATTSGIFTLTVWGTDQVQAPYDFTCNLHYNYTTV